MKKISIITINYNNRDGLQKTIESVINQTAIDVIDYIIIDGGSTDGSKELIEQYQHYTNYWISEPDHGIYHAMNKGIEKATGTYLLFLNSGDFLFDNHVIKKCCSHMSNHHLYYGQLQITDSLGHKNIMTYPRELPFSFFVQATLPHPATFIQRNLFYTVGMYDVSMKICADWDFFIRTICLHNATYYNLAFPISSWSIGGISTRPDAREFILEEKNRTYNRYFHSFIKETEELILLRKRLYYIDKSYVFAISRWIEKCKSWLK